MLDSSIWTNIVSAVLDKHGRVSLKDIGILSDDYRSAQIDTGAEKIQPPRRKLGFVRNMLANLDGHITSEIAHQARLSHDDAKKQHRIYLEKLKAQARKGQQAEILQDLHLSLRDGHLALDGYENYYLSYDFLPELDYKAETVISKPAPKPLESAKVVKSNAVTTSPKPKQHTNPQTEKRRSRALWPVLIALGLLVAMFMIYNNGIQQRDAYRALLVSAQESLVMPSEENDVVEDTSDLLVEEVSTETAEVITDETSSLATDLAQKPCRAVVGHFVHVSNANRMLEKLDKFGLSGKIVKWGKYNKVIVPLDCSDERLDYIKTNIESEAWLEHE